MLKHINAYEILGVPEGTDIKGIKKVYYRLAQKYHPDLNPGNVNAEEKMKIINMAYMTIMNGKKEFLYNDTVSKKIDLSSKQLQAINELNGLDFLLAKEKDEFISNIKSANDISIIKNILELAKNLNRTRNLFIQTAIKQITQYKFIDEKEKQIFINDIRNCCLESDINIILNNAELMNKLNEYKSNILKSLNSLIYLDNDKKERYRNLINKAKDNTIVKGIYEEAREKNDELRILLEKKEEALSRLNNFYYSSYDDMKNGIKYIKDLDNLDYIDTFINMLSQQSEKYEAGVKERIAELIELYCKSFVFNREVWEFFVINIKKCRSLDMVESYDIALHKIESLFCSAELLTVKRLVSGIDDIINSTANPIIKDILLKFKRKFENYFFIDNPYEVKNNTFEINKFDNNILGINKFDDNILGINKFDDNILGINNFDNILVFDEQISEDSRAKNR